MRFFDLFAGIGGFRLAFELEGYECVGFCEIDTKIRRLYKAIYNAEGEFEWDDVQTLPLDSVPDFEVLTAGVPCQPFSLAGRREGLKDERAYPLWQATFRLIEAKRPYVCVIENVKGLLSADRGWAFAYFLHRMDELGYDAEWTVFNSKAFGVPQNRERVYIIFHLRGKSTPKIFPISEADKVYYTPPKVEGEENGKRRLIYDPYNRNFKEEEIAGALRTNYSNGNSWVVEKPIKVANTVPSGHRAGNVYSPDGIAPTFTENHGKVCQIAEKPVRLGHIGNMNCQGNRVYSAEGVATTILSGGGGRGAKTGLYAVPEEGEIRIRRLTPLECFRLQGFPDWVYEKARKAGASDSLLYKAVGNAITIQIAQTIARKLKKALEKPNTCGKID